LKHGQVQSIRFNIPFPPNFGSINSHIPNRMNRFFTCCICLLTSVVSQAQSHTYIGSEVAYSEDIFHMDDPGGYLKRAPLSAALWGVNIRHVMLQHLFVETGLYSRGYKQGIMFKNEMGTTSTDRSATMIPFRIGGRFPFFKEAIAVCPVVGYTLALASEGQTLKVEADNSFDGTRVQYIYTLQYVSQSFSLLQAGLGVDIRLARKVLLSINSNYYSGLNKTLIQHISYSVNNGANNNATAYTKGSFYTVGIGIRAEIWADY